MSTFSRFPRPNMTVREILSEFAQITYGVHGGRTTISLFNAIFTSLSGRIPSRTIKRVVKLLKKNQKNRLLIGNNDPYAYIAIYLKFRQNMELRQMAADFNDPPTPAIDLAIIITNVLLHYLPQEILNM